MTLSPKIAAELAAEIYAVQNDVFLKHFLQKPIFSGAAGNQKMFEASVGTRLINTRDGFCVASRGGAEHQSDLFLMFRGSTTANYGADWFNNARCGVEPSGGGLVHIGFSHIFNSMLTELSQFVQGQVNDIRTPVNTIHCIGHSLGGAVATIAAHWAKRATQKHVELYTFGAPKPGFENFSRSFTSKLGKRNIHRMYHSTDPVPMVPLYPFTHPPMPGYGHYKSSGDSIFSAGAHDMQRYIQSTKGATWNSLYRPPPNTACDKFVEKWLEAEGSLNPFSASTWGWINASLEYVLKRILGAAGAAVQGAFTGAFTLADKIAWTLHRGIDLVVDAGKWVLLLIRRMQQVIQMKVTATIEELTHQIMRAVLERIMSRISAEAKKAVMQINR